MRRNHSTSSLNPDQVAGLKLWLKGDDVTGVDGDPVTTWTDASGLLHDASQSTSALKPTLQSDGASQINGHNVVRFDGVDDVLEAADHADLEMNTDSTIFVVARVTNFSANRTFVAKDAGAAAAGAIWFAVATTSGKPVVDRPFIEAGVAATNGLAAATPTLVTAHVSGTTVSHFKDGVANGTDVLATGTATNIPLRIGAFYTSSYTHFMLGDIAEVAIYNVSLSAGDRGAIEAGLKSKYGIA
jgi:hypothetical protein